MACELGKSKAKAVIHVSADREFGGIAQPISRGGVEYSARIDSLVEFQLVPIEVEANIEAVDGPRVDRKIDSRAAGISGIDQRDLIDISADGDPKRLLYVFPLYIISGGFPV